MNNPVQISKENAEFQIVQSLKENRKKRKEKGEIFVEGIETIKQLAASSFSITRILYSKGIGLSPWGRQFVNNSSARILELSDPLYRKICDRDQPSELLVTAEYHWATLSEWKLKNMPRLLILDRPSDKGNLGTIIRSSNALGIDGILILGHAVDVTDSKVLRTSLGGVFHIPVFSSPSMDELENWLQSKRNQGLCLIGSDSDGDCNLHEMTAPESFALVLGNEAKGMSRRLKELCDKVVSIPMKGQVNSLNMACAGSILLWHLCS